MRSEVAALACVALLGCKRETSASTPGDAAPAPVTSAPDAADVAPRCVAAPPSAATAPTSGEVGVAAVVGGHAYIGAVATGASAEIVRDDASASWVIARGASILPDAPPPLPVGVGDALYAVGFARGGADASTGRALTLVKLAADGKVAPVASFPQHADDSFGVDATASLDASRVAIAWEDANGIALAVAPVPGGSIVGPRVVSPDGAEVDQPRVTPHAAGWWATWIEHRAEDDASGPRVEGPAEDRAYAWVDLVALDASGAPTGNLRRVTSLTGHVTSYDLALRPTGELDLFARDDTEAREASGGRVLHVVVSGEHVGDAVALVDSGLGRGAIDVLVAPTGEAWLTWFDHDDQARLAPLDASRALAAPPSLEPSLDGARLVASLGSGRFLAGFAGGDGSRVRSVTCTR
jgi:hypothetical protein